MSEYSEKCKPINLAFKRPAQENYKIKASLDYIAKKLSHKIKNKNKMCNEQVIIMLFMVMYQFAYKLKGQK